MKKDADPSLVDLDFMNARARLLDVAAFFDRVERHREWGEFRVEALRKAIPLLLECGGSRVEAILKQFSDLSEEPVAVASMQGACGVPVVTGVRI